MVTERSFQLILRATILLAFVLVAPSPAVGSLTPLSGDQEITEQLPLPDDGPEPADLEAWDAFMADVVVEFDPYRIDDAELQRRRGFATRYLQIYQANADSFDPLIAEAKKAVEVASTEVGRLEPIQSSNGQRLGELAIGSYKSADESAASLLRPAVSGDLSSHLSAQRHFDQATGHARDEYRSAQANVQAAIEVEQQAKGRLDALNAAKAESKSRLHAANNLVADFVANADARDQRVADRTQEALTAGDQVNVELAQVQGITVAVELVEPVQALLDAAAEDEIIMSGWGHRPVSGQVTLRRSHCGTSEWAIFDRPSSQCGPPTARPGSSQHELGLAIDFTEGGRVLDWDSPGFLWMQENAATYGLKNLPSEPWHWSTTGD